MALRHSRILNCIPKSNSTVVSLFNWVFNCICLPIGFYFEMKRKGMVELESTCLLLYVNQTFKQMFSIGTIIKKYMFVRFCYSRIFNNKSPKHLTIYQSTQKNESFFGSGVNWILIATSEIYVGLCFASVGVQSWGSIKYCFTRCNVACIGRNLEEKEEENKKEKIAFGFQFPVIFYSHLISCRCLKSGCRFIQICQGPFPNQS